MVTKKKIGAFLLSVILLLSSIPLQLHGADTSYTGVPEGAALIKNATYTDIKGNANSDNIMKMSVYSLVREYGSSLYKPEQSVSRQDALASLVRAIGKQEDAVKMGEQLRLQDSSLSSLEAYNRGHIEIAKSSGIIQNNEVTAMSTLTKAENDAIKREVDKLKTWKTTTAQYNQMIKDRTDQRAFSKAYTTPVKREEAALWIARAMGLQPVKAEDTKAVYNYSDWKNIKTENIPYVEAVLQKGLMKGSAAGFLPAGTINRGEWASIMNTVAAASLDKLGYTTGTGKVTDIKLSKDIGAIQNQTATEITIQTPASDTVHINISKKTGLTDSAQEALPVIKGGRIGNEALLAEGDIVEYTATKNNQALLVLVSPLKEVDGTFVGYDYRQNLAKITDKNGNSYSLKVMPDSSILAQKQPVDIGQVAGNIPAKIVYANGILKSMDLDIPTEKVNNDEETVTILSADTLLKVVKVLDDKGNVQYLNLADDAVIYVNGQRQGVDAIGFDENAVLKVADGKILEMRIFTDVPVAEENFTHEITGRIRSVSTSGISLAADDTPDKTQAYKADGGTVVVKDGKTVNLSNLRQGDRVKIYVASAQDQYITRLEVQGEGAMIDTVYKGDIKDVKPSTREVTLGNVYSYGYYDWVKQDGYMRFKISDDADLYNGNYKVDMSKLKDYIGKSIYAVSRKDYGDEELTKAVLKDGSEDTLSKNISDIKWTTKQMALADGRTVSFKDGTIVMRDGRLLDTLDLATNQNAFIIENRQSDGTGSAAIVSLDSFNGFSNFQIVKGYLHNMGEDYFTVENSYKLTNNTWEDYAEPGFQLSDETYVYDNVFVKGPITPEKFAESRYKPFTYTWPNYATSGNGATTHEDNEFHYNYDKYRSSTKYHEHCLVYVFADGSDVAQAVNIYLKDKNSFNPNKTSTERMTAGEIKNINTANDIITLQNARDYSQVYQKWQPILNTSVSMDTEAAVVLKDGRQISLSDLEANDQIYVLSNNGKAIFIIAED